MKNRGSKRYWACWRKKLPFNKEGLGDFATTEKPKPVSRQIVKTNWDKKPMLLALDTSTRYASVALADEDRVVASRTWLSTANHTAELMPAVAHLMESRGLTAGQLDGVAVALGPGGFSALRVGISAAKGLALVARKPIVGVGTLDL